MSKNIQAIRGFNDVLPAEAALWRQLLGTAAEVFASYGYGEIRLPLVERVELFKRAVGEVTDVVEKEMYSFEDRGGEALALRPELTAGVVRAGIEHGLLHNQQQRLWYAGPAFRYERPQAGRYRQFHQIGVEAYGMAGPDIDIEVLALSARLWQRLGFRDLVLEVNSLGGSQTRAAYRAALIAYLQTYETSLDEDSRRRLHSNPLRVLDSKVPTTKAIVAGAPSILDHLDPESRSHWDGLQLGLSDLGIACTVNPRLVRGLDYYSKAVFEWTTTALGAQGTVCAGGRYDGLVEQLGGSPAPAVGFACGVERLVLLLQAQQAAALSASAEVYLCVLGEAAERRARSLAEELRSALPKLRLIGNAGGGKLKSQLGRAEKSGATLALVLGEAELSRSAVQVKCLRNSFADEEILLVELAGRLARMPGLSS